jgi:MIP family channel proteins
MGRRYIAEFVGTFGIVFAPVALSGATTLQGADSSLLGAALVSGLAVLAMISAFGPISAAHFNPAVTLGFTVAGRFPAKYAFPYWLSQFAGAIAAAGFAALLFGPGHGAHVPSVTAARAVGTEVVLTFMLMIVIMAVATDRRVDGALPALAIGLTVVLDVLVGGAVTGGSMNPARSFGPAIFAGGTALNSYWIYIIGPSLGAVLASRLYELIRGGESDAQGAPNELYEALRDTQRGTA